ncbi:type VII secretion system-associated protein [Streptomyces sp. NPDC094143]|uniref:type VII secretion system-associated protein n=1 Tax=Streptomyces sp. NPDC094143 TaxID=3155310 RepID=UPI003320DC15
MPNDQETVHLDRKWLERFLNDEVIPFRQKLEALLEDDPSTGIPSMWKLIGGVVDPETLDEVKPLAIGQLAGDDRYAGKSLNDKVRMSAQSIHETVKQQVELFKAVEVNIRQVIDELFDTQNQSLAKIDGRDFLDQLEDVQDIINSSGGPDATK